MAVYVTIGLSSLGRNADSAATADEANREPPLVREILVPFEALSVLLEAETERVFLTRDEYAKLLAAAREKPEPLASPQDRVLLAADYQVAVEVGRAVLTGNLEIEVLADGLHAVDLPCGGVGIRGARLDGQPAAMGLGDQGQAVLFVQGRGRHRLELEMVAPIQASAAQQTLDVRLPTPPATRLRVAVPGNVEVKSGARVIERVLDEDSGETRFQLLMPRDRLTLVMSLNNRMLQQQQVVIARSVVVDEVTTAYERLHANVSWDVLHGAVDRFQVELPEGFEPTEVTCPQLARWEVADEEGIQVLRILLREPTSETVVANLSATRTPSRLDDWTMPQVTLQDVAGQVAVLGLIVEDRLVLESLEQQQLIPVDLAVLTAALPDSVLAVEPGTPRVRPIAAFYAPQADYAIQARFARPPARFQATTNLLLVVDDTGHRLLGGFALMPEVEKLFSLRFTVPEGWDVTEVTAADGTPLSFERMVDPVHGPILRVRLNCGTPIGEVASVSFRATHAPTGWLGSWTEQQFEFPRFAILDAARDVGAIAIRAEDDLEIRPDQLTDLMPLDENEKAGYGLGDVVSNLAYRYDSQPFAASLRVSRMRPWVTARCFSFLRITPEGLFAHYELFYDIQRARARRLSLRLPGDTPQSLSITGLEGLVVKEFSSEELGDERRWTASLAEPAEGVVRLAVEFQQPLPEGDLSGFGLPLAVADDVAYQSAVVAVEGHAELDIDVHCDARRVDVGELVATDYQVGRRLLGVFGFAGAAEQVVVDVQHRQGYGLPPAIVQRAEMVTVLASSGVSQTSVRYQLRTKASFLEVRLPESSQLWSVYLDRDPVAPQRDDDRLLLSLPATRQPKLRDLQIVYETPLSPVRFTGNVQAVAPQLLVRLEDESQAREVPLADIQWSLVLPQGHRLVDSRGTVFTDRPPAKRSPIWNVAGAVFTALGGIQPMALQSARESARRTALLADRHAQEAVMAERVAREDAASERGYASEGADAAEWSRPASPADGEPMPSVRSTGVLPAAGESGEGEMFGGFEAETATEALPQAALVEPPLNLPEVAERPAVAQSGSGRASTSRGDTLSTRGSVQFWNGQTKNLWALQGIRSLKIDLQHVGDKVTFQGLGVAPQLDVTLVNADRVRFLAWGVAVVVFAAGVLLTWSSVRGKVRYLAVTLITSLALPVIVGDAYVLNFICELVFYAACMLVPYYLLFAACRWVAARLPHVARRVGVVTAGMLLLVATTVFLSGSASAQTGERPGQGGMDLDTLRDLLAAPQPIQLPDDAVILPYDADGQGTRPENADRVLVPYATYVDLWNRAFPEQRLKQTPPVVDYSLAGATFRATLADAATLVVRGQIALEVFVDRPIQIPLSLEQGVIAAATLDGRAARLQLVQPAGPEPNAAPVQQLEVNQVQAQMPHPPVPAAMALLQVSGKGRKNLELTIQMNLEKRGGWRVVAGRLPAAPATSLVLNVPAARTEVRLDGKLDRSEFETEADDQTITTALAADGRLALQWRAKGAESQVDQSLTVGSEVVLDVQEDGLRLAWQLSLDFPRHRRDAFRVTLPADYLVERVEGDNVRAWETKDVDGAQRLEVTLLNEALDRESLTLRLSRRGSLPVDRTSQVIVPVIRVEGALLHRGRLTVRRSPWLDLRATQTDGVSRTDLPEQAIQQLSQQDVDKESPLGLKTYQAYEFTATPFRVALDAVPVSGDASARLRTLLRIAERDTSLETRVLIDVRNRPVHRVQLRLPEELSIEKVAAPGEFQWSETVEPEGRRVNVFLDRGQTSAFSVDVRGVLGRRGAGESVPLPRIEVLDVRQQRGEVVVQIDPAYDVRMQGPQNCEEILLSQVFSWLQAGQRNLARLALRYQGPQHAAQFLVTRRSPRVSGFTVTNVKLTDIAIEETIILDVSIQDAGIDQLSFRLPDGMEDARISAPMLRQKSIEDAGSGQQRYRLDLQDEILGQFRVLIEYDRPLPAFGAEAAPRSAPIPVLETGRTQQRYVTLENASRDEVVVVRQNQLQPLGRQQSEWKSLASILGDGITTAFLVAGDAEDPGLAYTTKQRKTVETAGASIGLSETTLVVDRSGGYRGQQVYHVTNTTEQYLVIQLPAGAELWTATVSGDPVKPTPVKLAPGTGAAGGQIRIPLIKTAEGDSDYPVVLKYGGALGRALQNLRKVRFPLIRSQNIEAEISRVRLWLPDDYEWFDFGGSMRRVRDKREYEADYFTYNLGQMKRLMQAWNSDNPYAKVRVANNMKSIGLALQNYQEMYRDYMDNSTFNSNFNLNSGYVAQAQQETERYFAEEEAVVVEDNRRRLNSFWMEQRNGLANNVVTDLEGNFDAGPVSGPESRPSDGFNYEWFSRNQLDAKTPQQPEQQQLRFSQGGRQQDAGEKLKAFARDNSLLQQRGKGGKPGSDDSKPDADARPEASDKASLALRQSQRTLTREYRERLGKSLDDQLQAGGQTLQGQVAELGGEPDYETTIEGLSDADAMQRRRTVVNNGRGQVAAEIDAAGALAAGLGTTSADGSVRVWGSATAASAYLASLDVQLPARGTEFLFTTPRGEIEITGRAVSSDLLDRAWRVAGLLAGLLGLWLAWRVLRWVVRALAESTWAAAGLLLCGLFSLLIGVLPLAGLLAIVCGLTQLVRLGWQRHPNREPAPS